MLRWIGVAVVLALASACSDDDEGGSGGSGGSAGSGASGGSAGSGASGGSAGSGASGGSGGTTSPDHPTAVITPAPGTTLEGMAPFAVHVHGTLSSLKAGTPASAMFRWSFGDASGRYDELVGFNASHIYDQPGSYTITLALMDELGRESTTTLGVTVTADTRKRVHVSAQGNDANDGATEATAVASISRASELVGDATAVLFRRGDQFSCASSPCLSAGDHNGVLVGAYGNGDEPVLHFTGGPGSYGGVVASGDGARDVVIQDLAIETVINPPSTDSPRGIQANGTNVTVRRVDFTDVGDALAGTPSGGLYLDNTTNVIGAYFMIGGGDDAAYLGNQVGGSMEQHNLRIYASRQLYFDNDLTNASSSALATADGDYHWVANNRMRDGAARIGYEGSNHSATEHNVWDGNYIEDTAIIVFPGNRDVFIRNNIINVGGVSGISLWGLGTSAPWENGGVTQNVRVVSNTLLDASRAADVGMGHGADANIVFANNLVLRSDTGGGGSNADVHEVSDANAPLSGLTFHGNVWQAGLGFSVVDSPKTLAEWNAYAAVEPDDAEDDVTLSGTLPPAPGDGIPSGSGPAQDGAQPYPGVFTDYFGEPRPASGPWRAGAVR